MFRSQFMPMEIKKGCVWRVEVDVDTPERTVEHLLRRNYEI